jgi:hypothetical protein
VDYSSTVEGDDSGGGKPLLASIIRMQFGELLIHLSGPLVQKEIVGEVAARLAREGISKETIDRCIVGVLREKVIAHLRERSPDEEKILSAVRALGAERREHEEGLLALLRSD